MGLSANGPIEYPLYAARSIICERRPSMCECLWHQRRPLGAQTNSNERVRATINMYMIKRRGGRGRWVEWRDFIFVNITDTFPYHISCIVPTLVRSNHPSIWHPFPPLCGRNTPLRLSPLFDRHPMQICSILFGCHKGERREERALLKMKKKNSNNHNIKIAFGTLCICDFFIFPSILSKNTKV